MDAGEERGAAPAGGGNRGSGGGSGWRTPNFVRQYASVLSAPQKQRMDKIYHEPLFLLASPNESAYGAFAARFSVSGSTGVAHTVAVKTNGAVVCSCQDARVHARKCHCVCKHACFVLTRVMGFTDLSFFLRGLVLPFEQIVECAEVAAGRAAYDAESAALYQEEGVPHEVFYVPKKTLAAEEDECPVCYDALVKTTTTPLPSPRLVWCPDCRNAAHEECMKRWKASTRGAATTCVLCRSLAWKRWRPLAA